ncbi:peptidoglycan-binding domain-containing protein [Methanobacterium paludis]|uniref:Peptidoglycan-binding domain 1 protein n=1 Tax=Methanobacterium paludis (strain DSM 25820 / JCM 18151 / SWAN1) TaxID=868131 RepID=F6D5N0_METPW|nr:peptidoglycan-binding domain-containing protein [Methanobacterium paludis]AEG17647.1 Peptidoglycan-binding domain 1 protein [Methanobacterium paludis]
MFGRGGGTINRKITYTTALVLCVLFSALPFAGAADTQNIQNNNVNTCLNQSNVGTNAVTDNGLKIGATGNQVIELQKWLKNQGYYTGAIDGSFGQYTQQAVKLFQTDANITIDGWVSTQTENAMKTLTGTNPITNNNNTKTTTKSAANQTTTVASTQTAKTTKNTTATATTSANTKTTASTKTIAATSTSSKSVSTIAATAKTVTATAKCSCGALGNYLDHTVTFLNYCPECHKYGTLVWNPKGTAEGEWTCSACDADYCAADGNEKLAGHPTKLTLA